MKLYCVKDVLASSICLVFSAKDDNLAKRTIEGYICAPVANSVNTFVNDKQLYCIGEMDDNTMQVTATVPAFVCNIFEVRDHVLKDLCQNEQFVKAQLNAVKKQKEVINGKPTKRKTNGTSNA